MFAQTLSPQEMGRSAAPHERRKHPRFQCQRVISGFLITGGNEDWPVELFDVSRGGFGLRISHPVGNMKRICVDLYSPAGLLDRRIEGRVVRVHRLADGNFRVGCAFAGELSEAELQRFL
jgi:hypothetical protein